MINQIFGLSLNKLYKLNMNWKIMALRNKKKTYLITDWFKCQICLSLTELKFNW